MLAVFLLCISPVLAVGCCYCLWRAWRLFSGWRPAAASVLQSDYPEAQQHNDFWSLGFTLGTLRGWNWRDGEDCRLIRDRVVFEDDDGNRHRVSVERQVRRGWRPHAAYIIWYDPRDPGRATAFGPGHWLMVALALGIGLAVVLQVCGEIGRGAPL